MVPNMKLFRDFSLELRGVSTQEAKLAAGWNTEQLCALCFNIVCHLALSL
jgi:hypothetical protein